MTGDLFDGVYEHPSDWPKPTPAPMAAARFTIGAVRLQCPHCRSVWEEGAELRPMANPFLADRCLLVGFCRGCTSFSVLAGDIILRKLIGWETAELSRTGRLVQWRQDFIADRTG